jgi:glycosyltransferase involved in cell wall biosynthesis
MSIKVSILIPCYNAEEWIGKAIESAIDQSYPHTEVIVYDDGSTDGSWDVIQSFGDRSQAGRGPNRGGGAARNWLLERARGPWVQYLDADDYLKPDKIKRQVNVLQQLSGKVDVLYGPVTMQYHNQGRALRQERLPIKYPDDSWASLVTWDLPQTGSPLWRKQALLDVGGWKEDQPVCQEHELYLRLLKAGKVFQYADAGGAVYRQWSEETVCRHDEPKTYHHRVDVMQRAEAFMISHDQMTPQRREALNRAYLECSRMIWLFDRPKAVSLMKHVEDITDGAFTPPSDQVPEIYRWLYSTVGFNGAEQVAHLKRRVFGS